MKFGRFQSVIGTAAIGTITIEIHEHEGFRAHVAVSLQGFYHVFECHILISENLQRCVSDAFCKLQEPWVAGNIRSEG